MGFHAPTAGAPLFGASVAVGAWALLADGSLALRGVVGLGVHRRGVIVLALGLAILPVAAGQIHRVEVVAPCLLCAAVLGRVGLVRWPGLEDPAAASDSTSVPTPDSRRPDPRNASAPASTATAPAEGPTRLSTGPDDGPDGADPVPAPDRRGGVRVLGRAAGRAGTILGRDASVAIPRAARAAGRVAGRVQRPPEQP